MKIAIGQINPKVGAISQNKTLIIEQILKADEILAAELVIFPELAVTGYPLDDWLTHEDFIQTTELACQEIAESTPPHMCVILGAPVKQGHLLYNAALVIESQQIKHYAFKQALPNYGVFDEKRHFTPGTSATSFRFQNQSIALAICEDLWDDKIFSTIAHHSIDLIVSINASPFDQNKPMQRETLLEKRATEANCPVIYANLYGGQDELVFDGGSMASSPSTGLTLGPLSFYEGLFALTFKDKIITPILWPTCGADLLSQIYCALCLGVKDYVEKNGFSGVLIGLSGGIDSALTLAIAVDALGANRVRSVMLPSEYTSDISIEDAQKQADYLHVQHQVIPITKSVEALSKALPDTVTKQNLVQQNLQARIRGVMLMAFSNATGDLLLATSNKSELATGYSTLYGDMCGGFCVLKDVYKTLVYDLANYRNGVSSAIPERVITRPPSAELQHDQTDQDTLPPYSELDAILYYAIEEGLSQDKIIEKGYNPETVRDSFNRLYKNEYKRRQGAPGVKITSKAFGRDRRFPITSGY